MEIKEIDPKLCIAHKINQAKVDKYKALMLKGEIFPPVDAIYKDGKYFIKDGAHRTRAHLELNELVWANVFEDGELPDQYLVGKRLSWNKNSE